MRTKVRALFGIAEIDDLPLERHAGLIEGDQRLPAIGGQRVHVEAESHRLSFFAGCIIADCGDGRNALLPHLATR